MGEHRSAIECFDKALAVQPTHKQVLYNKGVALLKTERPEEALACLTKAVQVDSRYAGAWYVKAYLEKALDQKDAAIASCRAYLSVAATQPDTQRANVSAWLAELSR